ncbi:MAG: hypothetical protein IT456_28200 [Planctomycetes bacterium]|nr:hypothetical protein [Planctomycetota bacterium]
MAFTRSQRHISIGGLSLMAGLVLCPPWLVRGHAQFAWLWAPPDADAGIAGGSRLDWQGLHSELFVVALGMLLLLFLRERYERRHPPAYLAEELANHF